MIPTIMRQEIGRLMPDLDATASLRHAERESAAIIAFTSAIAAYGAFFIPKAYGTAISTFGGPQAALWGFALLCCVHGGDMVLLYSQACARTVLNDRTVPIRLRTLAFPC